ncbi:metal ABC transporter permease [Acinetobacter qingfengensis]|uniref:High-affinity zinc uptake system membrane protein ZnuB n=1 Tax=Acinetobacter qingfengensis TaxID=1262585 RepID=A0A1E7RCS8_9GAMM|nr:metal ABC transporter permease [Acinetobacter qingfengensis]KAA8732131.1 metal ABC transporter permease [Acinetobacter qingfengensis]OEY97210.1 DNA repair protein [Acinetobacter qingfengensis]
MSEWLSLLGPAWVMGCILPFLTAPLGCLMLWRRMSFFADTMAHGTLLGVAVAGLLALPLWLGVTALAFLLVLLLWFLHDQRLPSDALLALCSATLLCSGLLLIQNLPALRPELLSYLFGDLLTVSWQSLPVLACTVIFGATILALTWSKQLRVAIAEDIAQSEGIHAGIQRLIFMSVLALFTILALKVVGSLLMGALLVIPALTARLLAHSPKQMVLWAFISTEICITVGLWGSAWLDLSTGLTIVLSMAMLFILIFTTQKILNIVNS